MLAGLALYWAQQINHLYFNTTWRDTLAPVVTAVVFLLAAYLLRLRGNLKLAALASSVLPWIVMPATIFLISHSAWGSLLIHVFIVLIILTSFVSPTRWNLIPTVSLIAAIIFPWSVDPAQEEFYDKVVESTETRMGKARTISWKDDTWHYYNEQLRYSSVDQHIWAEAYIQPGMQLVDDRAKVLLIGGDDGVLLEELGKFPNPVTRLSYDSELTDKQTTGEQGTPLALSLQSVTDQYQIIILDLPDPSNPDYYQYYSEGFLKLCLARLADDGYLISHSGDLFSKQIPPDSIWQNARQAGFRVTLYHAQLPTVGQWTWFIGSVDSLEIRPRLTQISMKSETVWWNQEAMDMMLSFGNYKLLLSR